MKALTFTIAILGGLAFSTAASACPFGSMSKDKTADAPILKPAESTGS